MRYSTASFIGLSFILKTNEALISCVEVLLSGCSMLCYMLDAHLFLQPQLLTNRGHIISQYIIDAHLFLQPQPEPQREQAFGLLMYSEQRRLSGVVTKSHSYKPRLKQRMQCKYGSNFQRNILWKCLFYPVRKFSSSPLLSKCLGSEYTSKKQQFSKKFCTDVPRFLFLC